MKTSKLTITALCAALALVGGQLALAQGPEDFGPPMHHHGPRNITERLTHALNLSDAQKAQVQAKVAAVQPQLDAIRKQAHEQADAIIKQLHEQIRPLLNAEQQKRLDAIQTLRDTRPEGPE
ncbi:MAG: periplasmic heavy metal sensor [Bryobacteraceae bacterium]